MRPQGHPKAPPRLHQGSTKATPGRSWKAECSMLKGRTKPPKATAKPVLRPALGAASLRFPLSQSGGRERATRHAISIPLTVRLGIPTEGAAERADGRDNQHADERGIPAVSLHELAQTHARQGRAGVTEDAGQADGGGGGAFGGEIGGGDADEALRAIDEEARAAEEQGVQPNRLACHLPKEQYRDAGQGHVEDAGAEAAPAE